MNANRTRAIMAAQKVAAGLVRVKTDPTPTPEAPKLTAEQRKAIYAPKPATSAPQHLQGAEWVKGFKTAAKITYGATALLGVLFGGIVAKESKKGFKG